MEPESRQTMRTDIAASAIAHLSLVALVILISEVHPFRTPPPETVAVDIVTPEELKEAMPPTPQRPSSDLTTTANAEASNVPPSAPSQPAQQEAASPQPPPPTDAGPATAQPQVQRQSPQRAASLKPPEPDLTVKYGVMLGLPEELPPLPADDHKKSDGGDAENSVAAKLPAMVVAEFRRHLKSCAKLPGSIAPSDNVRIKLRAVMTTDGRLAIPPILIEASASAKGPILMQSAKSALEACQPYTMLPPDKYQEWKVMDLNFTPQDFNAP